MNACVVRDQLESQFSNGSRRAKSIQDGTPPPTKGAWRDEPPHTEQRVESPPQHRSQKSHPSFNISIKTSTTQTTPQKKNCVELSAVGARIVTRICLSELYDGKNTAGDGHDLVRFDGCASEMKHWRIDHNQSGTDPKFDWSSNHDAVSRSCHG